MPIDKLEDFFTGIYAKYLSAVDAEPKRSHQHEIGSNRMGLFLGYPEGEKVVFPGHLLYFPEDEEEFLAADTELTWYNTRWNMREKRGPEYRLYYRNNPVSERMSAGDFTIIARRSDGSILIIVTPPGTSTEGQLRHLFHLGELEGEKPIIKTISEGRQLSFVERLILETLGIEAAETDERFLDALIGAFGESFPTTQEFSSFARESLNGQIPPENDADCLFLQWFERETMLFRTFEEYLVGKKLEQGFSDVDDFIKFSLSVQNRRKARAGYAAENHLEALFGMHGIRFSRGQQTEGKSKPDFIFPGIRHYHDPAFPEEFLSMLGSKTTCKDRWRQVLTEANRISGKKLFTLEPAISVNQTEEMKRHELQLVVPEEIRQTYTEIQQTEVLTLTAFIDLANHRQRLANL